MKAVEFKEVNIRIAENQPEFITLPAFADTKEGSVSFGFELNEDELAEVARTGKIFIKQLTGNRPMQAIYMTTRKSELIPNSEDEPSIN